MIIFDKKIGPMIIFDKKIGPMIIFENFIFDVFYFFIKIPLLIQLYTIKFIIYILPFLDFF